ncbi:hypothetical protein C9374_004368 [Naegleria lovaniensis]|uniref:Uncharacterized protein n=1 Tax=Naegleria lovaniensis TaxID=51637 RepID=A0AA88GSC8_NAELO|nr:uncharacterized protein C9374_004368 [Naegleria lovaniensis]KAG2383697.1 hypothetical protein C9374_004368 [Naegleria lovaniensis]
MNTSSHSLFAEQSQQHHQQQQRKPGHHDHSIIISEQDHPLYEQDETNNPKRFSVASVASSVDFESSIQLKPSIFSISVDLLIITCSLGLAIWGLVYFTKYTNLPKARLFLFQHLQHENNHLNIVNNLLNHDSGQLVEEQQYYLSFQRFTHALTEFGMNALKNTFNTTTNTTASCNFSDLNTSIFNMVAVVSVSDLVATVLSIASVALVLIALVNAGRKLFLMTEVEDEEFYSRLNVGSVENSGSTMRSSVEMDNQSTAKFNSISMTTGSNTLEVEPSSARNRTLARTTGSFMSNLAPPSNFNNLSDNNLQRGRKSVIVTPGKKNRLFLASNILTTCRIFSGIISFALTLVITSVLFNAEQDTVCADNTNFMRSLQALRDLILPYIITQFGVMVLISIIVIVKLIVMYWLLAKPTSFLKRNVTKLFTSKRKKSEINDRDRP